MRALLVVLIPACAPDPPADSSPPRPSGLATDGPGAADPVVSEAAFPGVRVAPDGSDRLADGRVVFVAETGAGTNVAVADPASGAPPQMLTDGIGFHDRPIVDPDGTRVAYVAASEGGLPSLFVVPIDGGEPTQLTNVGLRLGPPGPDRLPASRVPPPRDRAHMRWDERAILYEAFDGSRWRVDPDGGAATREAP